METKSCKTCLRYSEHPENESPACRHCIDMSLHIKANTYDEDRIDVIAQNGNTGEHYAHVMSAPPEDLTSKVEAMLDDIDEQSIKLFSTRIVAVDEAGDTVFTLTSNDEFTAKIEVIGLIGNQNIDAVTKAMKRALSEMNLEG